MEIIVVDDCSKDDTTDLVRSYSQEDARIIYARHNRNRGLAAARNTAISQATGKYFTIVDDDDILANDFVEQFVNISEQYGDKYIFCCGSRNYEPSGNVVCIIPEIQGELLDYVAQGYTPPEGKFYATKDLIKIGGYNEKIKSGVDHDIWLQFAFNGFYIASLEKDIYFTNPHAVGSISRITTDWQKRYNGIIDSLEIWKNDIIRNMGRDFFCHFQNCYQFYLYKSFFKETIIKGNIKDAFYFFWRCNIKTRLFWDILLSLYRRFIRNYFKHDTCVVKWQPLFMPYRRYRCRKSIPRS